MRTFIGVLFIFTSLITGTYYFMEWYLGRSSAEQMEQSEVVAIQHEIESATIDKTNTTNDLLKNHHTSVVTTTNKPTQIPSSTLNFEKGEKISTLLIPKLEQKYSVYWGTDEDVLKQGVGMFVSELTTAPDGGGHTVISGHRDTVFYRLDELKEGDYLNVEYKDVIYTYQISNIFITDADDRSVIVKKDSPTLTLTTCYPFNYVGHAPDRYIIQADLIAN
ncbi:class D sortase [Metabacillus niabensis]|uniref:Sortase A n=1 Tax=Metabacillus niabensis TaxID=324854 RepID=A0ABT9Z6E7_9BACI|nr:class D sortase [Metabacillus niabensis]MDQ0227831.1 sortase A [Metabacillus niabensis]